MFSVGRTRTVSFRIGSRVDFGGNDDVLAGDLEVFEDFSEGLFAGAHIVDLGRVEIVDTVLEAARDDVFVLLVVFRFGVEGVTE